jgi:hypothetical protein
MINILEVSQKFGNQWVVIDRSRRIIDHGAELSTLYHKHGPAGKTFYFAAQQP